MPFINDRQSQERANLPAAEYHQETPWWDGYAASLGMVIDEELTISNKVNGQGWTQRRQQIQDLDIDLQPYTNRRGRIDYDQISAEYEGIKTDAQLEAERSEMLARRREFAQSELEHAPASAQFLGAMSGYLLDPVSIATMPISYSVKGVQGASILSRIGQTAARSAAIEGTTELAIQALVFDYKQDIESPYSARDAITAVATAATGAAALGGTFEGISGYLRSIRNRVDPETLTKGELKAYQSVQRMEESLEGVPAERQESVLREMETFSESYNTRTLDMFDDVDEPSINKAATASRESDVLNRAGLSEAYDQTAAEYAQLKNKVIFDGEDMLSADDLIKEFDDELGGLDNVMRCVNG